MYQKSKSAKQYLNALEEEYSSLENQYESITDDLDSMESSTGIEKEIRAKFDYGKEGEKAIMIIEEKMPEIQEPKKKGIWQKIKNWATF